MRIERTRDYTAVYPLVITYPSEVLYLREVVWDYYSIPTANHLDGSVKKKSGTLAKPRDDYTVGELLKFIREVREGDGNAT